MGGQQPKLTNCPNQEYGKAITWLALTIYVLVSTNYKIKIVPWSTASISNVRRFVFTY
ncbi:hypothetical protein SLEP1_g2304 [Rubroshorea leprosula]|uniref:Uncharacterized protein n=1 Tax=Rubroshorea leprosula TaxID=152421 RepID=A0AAV5HSI6_9ROSI|nr:hypothetical protein SLEP1_g2304 [Rubroshorea leprosula]